MSLRRIAGSTPWWMKNSNLDSSIGVRRRFMNSSPCIGMMLTVGFSETLVLRAGANVLMPGDLAMTPAIPAFARNSKVAAMLEIPVKWIGRECLARAMFNSSISAWTRFTVRSYSKTAWCNAIGDRHPPRLINKASTPIAPIA